MLKPAPPRTGLHNMRKDLHSALALALAHELGVASYLGPQASQIADTGVATGHDNPAL